MPSVTQPRVTGPATQPSSCGRGESPSTIRPTASRISRQHALSFIPHDPVFTCERRQKSGPYDLYTGSVFGQEPRDLIDQLFRGILQLTSLSAGMSNLANNVAFFVTDHQFDTDAGLRKMSSCIWDETFGSIGSLCPVNRTLDAKQRSCRIF